MNIPPLLAAHHRFVGVRGTYSILLRASVATGPLTPKIPANVPSPAARKVAQASSTKNLKPPFLAPKPGSISGSSGPQPKLSKAAKVGKPSPQPVADQEKSIEENLDALERLRDLSQSVSSFDLWGQEMQTFGARFYCRAS